MPCVLANEDTVAGPYPAYRSIQMNNLDNNAMSQ